MEDDEINRWNTSNKNATNNRGPAAIISTENSQGTPFSDEPPPYSQIYNPNCFAKNEEKTSVPANETKSGEDIENAFSTRLRALRQLVTRHGANQTHELQQTISQRMKAVDHRMKAVEQHLHERQPPSHLSEDSISRRVVNKLVNNTRFLSMIQSQEGSMAYSEVTDGVMAGSPLSQRCVRCICERQCTCRCHMTDLIEKWQRETVTDSTDRRHREPSNNKEEIHEERETTVSDIETDLDISRTFRNNLDHVSDSDDETLKSDRRNDKDRKMSSVKEKELEKRVYELYGVSSGDHSGGPPSDDSSCDDDNSNIRKDRDYRTGQNDRGNRKKQWVIESDLDVSRTFRSKFSYVSKTPKFDRRNEKDRKISSVKEKESKKVVYEVHGASAGDPGDPPSNDSSNNDGSDDRRRDKKNKSEKSHNDKTGKRAKRWIIDAAAWTICLDQESNFKYNSSSLIDQGKLPDQVLVNKICSKYPRPRLRNICDGICSFIKQKSDKIVHVWPAYQYKNDGRIYGKEITFVVLTAAPWDIYLSDFSTYIRCIVDVSSKKENMEINKKESNDRPSSEEMEDLEKCLKENARKLMERHRKLTRMTASWFKSRGHDTDEFSLRKEHCIALYVHVKGFIPLNEEPFPKKVGNYPVDVREGIFTLCGGPNDYHKNVKMGCAIRGGLNKGTLGAFVEFENDSCVYGITSAHVVFAWDKLREIMEEGQMQFQYPNTQTVYQPDHETFGSTVAALYRAGGNGIPGMEIAVVEIMQDRWPTDGTFPDDSNHSKLGFGPHRPFVFCSGKVDQLSYLKHSPVVYKYGSESGITKGLYRVDGASVRTQTFKDNILGTELIMHGQIEIESVGIGTFGEHGDSGSLVVTNEQGNNELFAVGIFEGKMSGEDVYTVTPICSVLDELRRLTNKQCVLKRFPQYNSISNDPGYSWEITENVTSLAATVSDLSKKVEKLDAHQNEIRDELRKQNDKSDRILQFLMSSQTQNNS